jgi:hypothetical protein
MTGRNLNQKEGLTPLDLLLLKEQYQSMKHHCPKSENQITVMLTKPGKNKKV